MNMVLVAAMVFAALFVLMLDYNGAYSQCNSLLRIRETERILKVSVQAFGLVFPATFFFAHLTSRWMVGIALVLVPLMLIVEKQILLQLIRHLHAKGLGVQNVLVYGAGFTGRSVFSALVRSPRLGLQPVAMIDDDPQKAGRPMYEYGYHRKQSIQVLKGPLTAELIQSFGAHLVVVGIPSVSQERLDDLLATAVAAKATLAFVPQITHSSEALTDYLDIDGVLLVSVSSSARRRWYEAMKRAFDFVAALLILVITLPSWLLVCVLIRRDSPGPIFFQQTRIGRDGRPFELYKFRSMFVDAAKYGLHPANGRDPRVTHVGRWLRRTGLDELPQLINILKGEMALVGPRPEMPFIVEGYDIHHRRRLDVMPGLTGLWQLSADRATAIHENLQYDLYYIRHRSFFMDLAILLHTLLFAMRGV